MTSATRNVVLHYHIFKNAGSTVDSALTSTFADRHGAIEGPHPWSTISSVRLAEFLMARPELQAVSSHQARLPLPPLRGLHAIPILFVRHPIDRFGSVYEFERKQASTVDSPSAQIARSGDIRGFAEWAISSTAASVVKNYQTLHIAGIDSGLHADLSECFQYAVAKKRLAALPFVGLVDRFEASMERFTTLISKCFPDFSGAYQVHNVSHTRSRSIADRIEELRDNVGELNFKKLVQCNLLDLRLYEETVRRFSTLA